MLPAVIPWLTNLAVSDANAMVVTADIQTSTGDRSNRARYRL